ncbi:MAG: hypothetical protein PHR25_03770 [Clostridia bacterium]|nr:hypothetical protein [Clostridia bacterium]
MKKGISLIVLVITIIVMIIIAGAIILSLNSSDITGQANRATFTSDRANLQAEYALKYAEKMTAENPSPTVAIGELTAPTKYTKYGAWGIDSATGTVTFTLNGTDKANFPAFIGYTDEAAVIAAHAWVKTGL